MPSLKSKKIFASVLVCSIPLTTLAIDNSDVQNKEIASIPVTTNQQIQITNIHKTDIKESLTVVDTKASDNASKPSSNSNIADPVETKKEQVKSTTPEVQQKPEIKEPAKEPAIKVEVSKEKKEEAKPSTPKEAPKNYRDVTVVCTFYTDLACENGGYAGRVASGGYLKSSSIAMPKDIPFGTKIEIEGIGTRICDDRGSSKYIKWIDANTFAVDIYIPRNKGEDDDPYFIRVNNMGRKKAKAKLYLK